MMDGNLARAIRNNEMTPSGRTGDELMWLIFDKMARTPLTVREELQRDPIPELIG